MRSGSRMSVVGTVAPAATRLPRSAFDDVASAREVRPVVAESWRRCAAAGGTFHAACLPPVRLDVDELRERRSRHPLAGLVPMVADLLGAAADDEHVFAIVDADGTLLWVRGNAKVLRRVERMNFVAGAGWAEVLAGTNAPGTALATGSPVQIRGPEHYSSVARPWSCAAAPVRDPDGGQILGALDLTGGADIGSPQALALVRATARAAEAELARQLAEADERARGEYARLPWSADGRTLLLSPGGRILDGPPGLLVATGGPPLDERRVVVEPVGVDGHLAVRFVDDPAPHDEGQLTALGRDSAVLQIDGRTVRLRPRHSEILVVLAMASGGLSGGRLAVELAEDDLARVTLRAEMSRLRTILGADLLASMPYRLCRALRSDFLTVHELLTDGRVAEALALYAGPLLPSSQAPAVCAARTALARHLRTGVLDSGDPALVRRWVATPWGDGDPAAWRRLADLLPGGSAPRAAAAGRAHELSTVHLGSRQLLGNPSGPSVGRVATDPRREPS